MICSARAGRRDQERNVVQNFSSATSASVSASSAGVAGGGRSAAARVAASKDARQMSSGERRGAPLSLWSAHAASSGASGRGTGSAWPLPSMRSRSTLAKATTPDAARTSSGSTASFASASTTSLAETTCVAFDASSPPKGRRSPLSPARGPRLSQTTPPAAVRTWTSPPKATVFDRSPPLSRRSDTRRFVGRFSTQPMTRSFCTAMICTSDLWRNCLSRRKSAPLTFWHARSAPGITEPSRATAPSACSLRAWCRDASRKESAFMTGASSLLSIQARSIRSSKSFVAADFLAAVATDASRPMFVIKLRQHSRPSSSGMSPSAPRCLSWSSRTNVAPSVAATYHEWRSSSPSSCFGAQPA
mmetsp:Transcript_11330/g.37075  ORF Transcript_11330/g.37075 Transcript_11330/m.37075 type:complete len:360 (+) Transcript_11330:942-2021(+)